MTKYTAKLTIAERTNLLALINKGKAAARKLTHARIILSIDEGEGNPDSLEPAIDVARRLHVSVKTVERIRKQLVEHGIEIALNRKQHSQARPAIIQGNEEAKLITLACSNPPAGQSKWTLKLLANKMVYLNIVDTVSPTTVGRALKKTN